MSLTQSRRVSLSRLRRPAQSDYDNLISHLYRATSLVRGKMVTHKLDHEEVIRRIVSGEAPALIIDEAFLLVYGIGTPWYSDNLYLEEQLVLRIGKGSDFSAITDTLDDLADIANVEAIIVASALAYSSKALTRLYTRQGYHGGELVTLVKRRTQWAES